MCKDNFDFIADMVLNGYGKKVASITPYSFTKDFYPGQIFLESEKNLYFGRLSYFLDRKNTDSRLEIETPNKNKIYLFSDSQNSEIQELLFSKLQYSYFGTEVIPVGNSFAKFSFPKIGWAGTLELDVLPTRVQYMFDYFYSYEYKFAGTYTLANGVETNRKMNVGIKFTPAGGSLQTIGYDPRWFNDGNPVEEHYVGGNSARTVYYKAPYIHITWDGTNYRFNYNGKEFGAVVASIDNANATMYLDGQSDGFHASYWDGWFKNIWDGRDFWMEWWMMKPDLSDYELIDKVRYGEVGDQYIYFHPKYHHKWEITQKHISYDKVASIYADADNIHFEMLKGAEYQNFVASVGEDYYDVDFTRLIAQQYNVEGQRAMFTDYMDYRIQLQFIGYKITLS